MQLNLVFTDLQKISVKFNLQSSLNLQLTVQISICKLLKLATITVYLDVGANPVTLSVVTSGPSYARNWRIKITHIPCSSLDKGEYWL